MLQEEKQEGNAKKDKIILNVGGKRFEPYRSTLRNHPDMPLAWITQNKEKLDYDPESGEFFFDRHPMVFTQILNYFQTGKLHCPRGMCGPCFQDELTFWGIHERQMESCCWSAYTSYRDAQDDLKALDLQPKYTEAKPDHSAGNHVHPDEIPPQQQNGEPRSFWSTYKPVVWEILDEPYSSTIAKVYGWVSLVFVVISVFTGALWTVSLFQDQQTPASSNNTERLFLLVIEGICTAWFSCEFILRLALCPSFTTFVLVYQNWIDLLSIIPAYLILFNVKSLVIDIMTSFRILRILRFGKLLYDLQIIGKTFKASWNLFLILLFVLFIPVLVCSSALYYTERNHGDVTSKSQFSSVPASLWWGLVTVTTVGYGDLRPTSFPGKIFGVFCALCGVLLVAMSASIAGSSFALYYNLARTQMKLPKERRKLSISCENLPAILRRNAHSVVSTSPEDSGCDQSFSADSKYMRKDFIIQMSVVRDLKDENKRPFTDGTLSPDAESLEQTYIETLQNNS